MIFCLKIGFPPLNVFIFFTIFYEVQQSFIKEMLQIKTLTNYQNLSEEDKNKKRENVPNRYRKIFIENELSEVERREYAREK